jgi:hypothetical protein
MSYALSVMRYALCGKRYALRVTRYEDRGRLVSGLKVPTFNNHSVPLRSLSLCPLF